MKCKTCEEALRQFQKPINCEGCPGKDLELLEANLPAWVLFLQIPRNNATGNLDFDFLRFYCDMYLQDMTAEDKQLLFEKVFLIYRTVREVEQK